MDNRPGADTMPGMAKGPRIRLQLDTDERRKRAFLLYAAFLGMSVPEAFDHLIDTSPEFAKWLKLADESLAAEAKPPKPPKK